MRGPGQPESGVPLGPVAPSCPSVPGGPCGPVAPVTCCSPCLQPFSRTTTAFLCWQNTTAASDRTDATSATTTATRRRLLLAEHASDPIPILLSNPARMARSGGAHGSTTPAQPRGSRQSMTWGATEPAYLDNNRAAAAPGPGDGRALQAGELHDPVVAGSTT